MRCGAPCATAGRRSSNRRVEALPPVHSTGVHHVDLVVSSIERSLPFYRDLLAPLGYHGISEVEGERGETIYYLWGPGSSIGLREAKTTRDAPYDRYEIGLHHLAVEAASRAVVDERAEWLRRDRRRDRERPEEYAYDLGYYAVFFYDPDGIKLEIVHVPRHAA